MLRSDEAELDFDGALRLCGPSCGHERDVERLRTAEATSVAARGEAYRAG